MQIHAIAPFMLIVSIALSWDCFASTFDDTSPAAASSWSLPMLASAVCITSFGLAFSGETWLIGVAVAALGLVLGRCVHGIKVGIAVPLSAAVLLTYLRFALFLHP
ncbi:MAG: hypothetical protein KGI75_25505 [Rhizobiaceae bacterium]|nr:hypothetical protein [Rhizobiaceae bacterium]